MPHKQYIKFATQIIDNTILIKFHPLGPNAIADQVPETVAAYANNDAALEIAKGTCRLLNQAYSSGHARGMEYVKESLINSMGLDD